MAASRPTDAVDPGEWRLLTRWASIGDPLNNGAVHAAPAEAHPPPGAGLHEAVSALWRRLFASRSVAALVAAACVGFTGAAVYLIAVSPAASREGIRISWAAGYVPAVGLALYVLAKRSRAL